MMWRMRMGKGKWMSLEAAFEPLSVRLTAQRMLWMFQRGCYASGIGEHDML